MIFSSRHRDHDSLESVFKSASETEREEAVELGLCLRQDDALDARGPSSNHGAAVTAFPVTASGLCQALLGPQRS